MVALAERSEAAPTALIRDDLSLHLPNIRSLFEPDDGYVLVEGDLARADAYVAAWDADAASLKAHFRSDHDIHSENADMLFAHRWDGPRLIRMRDINPHSLHTNGMSYRDNAKRWVHATNFAGGARTVGSVLALDVDHVERCQRHWTEERHPELGRWHRRIEYELASSKMPIIRNAFGFRRVYVGGAAYGRNNSNLLGQALGWLCQSTVAIVINKAIERIDCNLDLLGRPRCGTCLVCAGSPIQLLLQVHDSALMQTPSASLTDDFITSLRAAMDVEVPYDDPLHIPVEVKWSAKNYGEMRKWMTAHDRSPS